GAGHDGRRVDHREAGGAARLHRLLEALLGGGDEGAADRPADDGALELEAAAAGERLEVDDAHAELAVAAGLLLVPALDAGDAAGHRLPVGDAHVLGVDVGAEPAGQLLERDLQVRLAGAVEDRLAGLVVALDA